MRVWKRHSRRGVVARMALNGTYVPSKAEWVRKQVEKALRKQPPATSGRFFAWLTDGMDPESAAYVRQTVPAPVVAVFSRVLGRRYHREVAPVWKAGA